MYYNTNCNCNKQEKEKKCCFKIIHEICTYPSYYNENEYTQCNDERNFVKPELEFNYNNHTPYNCNNKENIYKCKEDCYNNFETCNHKNNCERKNSRCCFFRRWCW